MELDKRGMITTSQWQRIRTLSISLGKDWNEEISNQIKRLNTDEVNTIMDRLKKESRKK